MAMTMSKAGFNELIGHEAIVQTRYRDSADVWTIGIGHTKSAGPPNPATFKGEMSIDDVIALFEKDLARYVGAVNSAVKTTVSQTEFDALVSFHFNTGGIKVASLVKSLNKGDRDKAADEFMNWSKPPEIVDRRKKEQKLFRSGVYSNNGKARVVPADKNGTLIWSKSKTIEL